jgi:short-subunit dehydrogenase
VGCVVFTSSAAACQPTPFSALYGATKAGALNPQTLNPKL